MAERNFHKMSEVNIRDLKLIIVTQISLHRQAKFDYNLFEKTDTLQKYIILKLKPGLEMKLKIKLQRLVTPK